MRSTLMVAPILSGLMSVTALSPASADSFVETDVAIRFDGMTDGSGTVKVLPRTQGDFVCTGTIRLLIRRDGKVVVDREKSAKETVRFRIGALQQGEHLVIGKYRLGEQDPCSKSVDRRPLTVN